MRHQVGGADEEVQRKRCRGRGAEEEAPREEAPRREKSDEEAPRRKRQGGSADDEGAK